MKRSKQIKDIIYYMGLDRVLSIKDYVGGSVIRVLVRWTDVLGRVVVAFVFIYAAIPKLGDIAGFASVIEAYSLLPEMMVFPVAIVLPVLEVVLAVGILLGYRYFCIGGLGLMVVFISILSYAIFMGLDIDCGCFGPEDPEYSAFKGLRGALVRDLLLLLPLIYSIWLRYLSGPKNNN